MYDYYYYHYINFRYCSSILQGFGHTAQYVGKKSVVLTPMAHRLSASQEGVC